MTIEYDIINLLKIEKKCRFNSIHKEVNKPDSLVSRTLTDLVKKGWITKSGTKATGGVYYAINKDNAEAIAFLETPDIYLNKDKILKRYMELRAAKELLEEELQWSPEQIKERIDQKVSQYGRVIVEKDEDEVLPDDDVVLKD